MSDRRPITAAIRRRAWGEFGVRPWSFLTLALLVLSGFMSVGRIRDRQNEAYLIEHGTPVQAEITALGLGANARQAPRDEPVAVMLRYTPPGSSGPLDTGGVLPRKAGETAALKQIITVRILPERPEFWTERTEPAPLGTGLVAPGLCALVAVGCAILAVFKRSAVVAAYRSAEPRRATVASVRQSPLAPFSKLIGVTVDGDVDRRVRDCYWPTRCGTVHPGQAVDVLVARRRTFAAAAYGQGPGGPAGDVL